MKLTMLILLLLFASCRGSKVITNTEFKTKDSVITKETIVYRDTAIFTAADSAQIKALVKCPENGVVNMPEIVVKSKKATAKAKIDNGVLTVNCDCSAEELRAKTAERTYEFYRSSMKDKNTTVTKPVKYIPRWVEILAFIGAFFCLYHFIKLGTKLGLIVDLTKK